jgi:RNA polymerase sigma-70 factor (ECF subfamily)
MRDVAACGLDEEEFRAFHAKTARPLRAYLVRLCRDRALADDVLQDAYLRFLSARLPPADDEAHRRNYLYRIATNLVRDHFRREKARGRGYATGDGHGHGDDRDRGHDHAGWPEAIDRIAADGRLAEQVATRRDVTRELDRLKPKERQMLWLAYVERFSHKEIAEIVGFTPGSIRPLLFRAKQKLADLLRKRGVTV